uniref:Uncharacterized protein n=1 Tax=Caenorhabditis japonica TaxID=281687 RepID=A0A8R1ED64_CAEJA
MNELSLNGGPIGDADVRIMCETPLNEERCARRENRSYWKPWILMGHVMENAKDAYDCIESKYLDDLERAAKKRNTSVTPRNINFHISNWLVAAK